MPICSTRSAPSGRFHPRSKRRSPSASTASSKPSPDDGATVGAGDAEPEGSAPAHSQRPLHPKDHCSDEGGGRLAAAPGAGAGRGGAPLRATHGAGAGLARRAHGRVAECAAAFGRHRPRRDPPCRRRHLGPRPRRRIRELEAAGKRVMILTIGRKGRDGLRRDYGRLVHDSLTDIGRRRLSFEEARDIAERILVLFRAGGFDACSIVYNRFRSAITQIVTVQQLIPFPPPGEAETEAPSAAVSGVYEFEPSEEEILGELLPQNLAVQIYTALLENAASEQGARMTAMDNATRNAGEMIDRLTLNYNRTRQAAITKELIEIISGAEAL